MESSRANFNQVYNSAIEDFFAGSRMVAGSSQKIVPKNFEKFTENHLLRSLFLIELLACSLNLI